MDHRPPGMIALALCLAACASSGPPSDTGYDLAPDLSFTVPDLAGRVDLSRSVPPDFSSSVPQDLAGTKPDLAMSVKPDLATAPADLATAAMCTLVPQTGCPAGQKCTTEDGDTTLCTQAGTQPRGAVCLDSSGVDNCVAGDTCTDQGGTGECRPYCKVDGDCGFAGYCDYTITGTGGFRVCSNPCTAKYPGTGCSAPFGCYAYGAEHTDCLLPAAGASDIGGPCVNVTDCVTGEICINDTCRRVCTIGDGTGCSLGNICGKIMGGGKNWITYGVCCPLTGC